MDASGWSRNPRRVVALTIAATCLLWPLTARPALVYKNYIIEQDSGVDILCAPYTVKAGDWVIKILKLRGEIAAQDFPHFLQIFSRINPNVKDVNRIRPGQQIFIPLREMPPGTIQGPQSGLVTIPFVDLSSRKTVLREAAATYRVRAGDTISKLMSARYGRYGSPEYNESIKQLQAMNPRIKDLDLIFVDQVIFLPDPEAIVEKPEMLASAPVTTRPIPKPTAPPKQAAGSNGHPGLGPAASGRVVSHLAEAAALMEANLLNTGTQVFPGGRQGTVTLDLSKTPVVALPDGQKVLLSGDNPVDTADLAAINAQWKRFRQLSLPANASLEQVLESVLDPPDNSAPSKKSIQLTTGGVAFDIRPKWLLKGPETEMNPIRHICITPIAGPHERTPSELTRYFANHGIRIREVIRAGGRAGAPPTSQLPNDRDAKTVRVAALEHRQFVDDLLNAMGYPLTRNVAISFPYAGIEVKAMSNLVTTRSGNPLFIDFGDLFGDAFSAISNTGFNIIQITAADNTAAVIDKITRALDEPLAATAAFIAAQRPKRYNTLIRIPGTLMGEDTAGRTLITTVDIAPPILRLLNDQRVNVVIVEKPSTKTPLAERARRKGEP